MNTTPQISLDASGKPFCLSTDVALHFQKKHKNVLREIEKIISQLPSDFHGLNFEPMFLDVKIGNGATRRDRVYKLSRDAFTLLAMGFTGKSALIWKLRYIEAFNQLEKYACQGKAISQNAGELAAMKNALSGRELARLKRQAYEEGFRKGEAKAIYRARQSSPEKIFRYLQKGLNYAEIGRLLGLDASTISKRVKKARAKGFWSQVSSQPVLPGVQL